MKLNGTNTGTSASKSFIAGEIQRAAANNCDVRHVKKKIPKNRTLQATNYRRSLPDLPTAAAFSFPTSFQNVPCPTIWRIQRPVFPDCHAHAHPFSNKHYLLCWLQGKCYSQACDMI